VITQERIRELAQFEDQEGGALSFYFQPAAPRNKAHNEEAILTKDLVRDAQRRLESKGKNAGARADLDRAAQRLQELRSNGARAKAIFACSGKDFWREYDLPAQLAGTQLFLDRRFHLKPLAHLLGAFPSLGVVLVDRHRARLFDLRLGELTEREGFFHPVSRRGRSDGFAGYDGGHAERRVADAARQHFKVVAEFLKKAMEKGAFERWILGCQEPHWPQLEAQLHPYVAQRLIGRFPSDLAHITRDAIREQAERIFAESQQNRCHTLVQEALSKAGSNGRGVTGLRRVLRSLEMGEIQALLLGENYLAQAVECGNCGHLDAHLVSFCPACGRETREVVDVGEAILPRVIRRDIELFYVRDDAEFDRVGNIAALLRFRSEQKSQNSNAQPIATVADHPSLGRQSRLRGRYRGLGAG
jgi:peptide subunit release factor 1 (eRF1)